MKSNSSLPSSLACPSCGNDPVGAVWCQSCGFQLKGAAETAPLVPLVAPSGVTGAALPASPVKDTPAKKPTPMDSDYFLRAEERIQAAKCATASTVESVGVPEPVFPLRVFNMSGKGGYVVIMDDEGRNVASMSDRFGAEARVSIAQRMVDACNSHAAKDAKIKGLTDALEKALSLISEHADHLAAQAHPDQINTVCDNGSDALALPTA